MSARQSGIERTWCTAVRLRIFPSCILENVHALSCSRCWHGPLAAQMPGRGSSKARVICAIFPNLHDLEDGNSNHDGRNPHQVRIDHVRDGPRRVSDLDYVECPAAIEGLCVLV